MYCDVRSDRCRVPFPGRPGGTRTTSRRLQVRKETYSRHSSNSSSPHEPARPACGTVRCQSGIFRLCRFSLRAEQLPRRQNGQDLVPDSPKWASARDTRTKLAVHRAECRAPGRFGLSMLIRQFGVPPPNKTEPTGSGPPKARHLPAARCKGRVLPLHHPHPTW